MGENFQALALEQGDKFRDDCLMVLRYAGFEIIQTDHDVTAVGIEVDIWARNAHGVDMFCECKGSMREDRPGCRRTDTLKKAIANAYLFTLSDEYPATSPLLLLASHIPNGGSGLAMLSRIKRSDMFAVLNPWQHGRQLTWLAHATPEQLQDLTGNPLIDQVYADWGCK